MPIFHVVGFLGISIISAWMSLSLKTKDLLVLVASATLLSIIDEYAHTSVGTLSYFDQFVPSPLTVFGWSVFMIFLVGAARFIVNFRSLQIKDYEKLRAFPVIALAVIVSSVIVLQGYLDIFNWVILLVYVLLFAASFYYTFSHPLKWNLILMMSSMVFGFAMEYVGSWEGMWIFRFNDPISFLILFSWPLRIWTVNAFCLVLDVDFSKTSEKRSIDFSTEIDRKKGIIVIADTHFGLKKEDQISDPNAFSDFLNWIGSLEQKGTEELELGIWSAENKPMIIKQPEKTIFLGDIFELWDATKKSISACSTSIL
jgi:hypothetical protein